MKRHLKSYNRFKKEFMNEKIFTRGEFSDYNKPDENLEEIKEDENNIDNETENINTVSDKENNSEFSVEVNIENLPITTNDSTNIQTTQDYSAPKMFSVVRILTKTGEKIGMCYTEDVSEYGTPIHNNLDFNSACNIVKDSCKDIGLEEFNQEFDKILGIIPSFMIPKKSKSTSYKPN